MRRLIFAFACTTACSSPAEETTESSEGGSAAHDESCESDARAMKFELPLEAKGAKGLSLSLLSADPAPPSRGDNRWMLAPKLEGADLADGAEWTVTPFMPSHGHGSSIRAEATPQADGSLEVTPINLWMPGLWEVTIGLKTGTVVDEAVFGFCIAE